jgi:hypothetical protein
MFRPGFVATANPKEVNPPSFHGWRWQAWQFFGLWLTQRLGMA